MKTFRFIDSPNLTELAVKEVDGKRYYISPNNIHLPSMTTILSHFKTASLDAWKRRVGEEEAERIKRRAGVRGTKFHLMMEKYLKSDDTIFEGVMPDMKMAFRDTVATLDRIDDIFVIEGQLYSEAMGVAGRTDVIAHFDGVPSIIDFKTSLKEKKEEWIQNYFEQETGYSLMYEELTGIRIEQIVTIISVDHLDYPQVFIKNRGDYIPSLLDKISRYHTEFSLNIRTEKEFPECISNLG